MPTVGDSNDPVAERNFYRQLLDLAAAAEPEPLLDQAMALIVSATGAQAAYLELHHAAGGEGGTATAREPLIWRAHGCTDAEVASIRASISRGIIARALADGQTVTTPSALSDPQFRDQPSVLRHAIQAVVCTPIGRPPIGVVYLQGDQASADFVARNHDLIECFARQLAPLVDRLITRAAWADGDDATREVRRRFPCDGLVGRSQALAHVLGQAAQVAPLDISVLITGPAGTGKTALARAIHANSRRSSGPFVEINCASIQNTLFENELFGAEPGAFSGAPTRRSPGKVGAARGGTLFLDEVGELTSEAQAKLLQLLEERHYYAVGGTALVSADVRVISATNADLHARRADGTFRDDLFYRLRGLPIAMPGLDERRADIPDLVEWFCAVACRRHGVSPLPVTHRALVACREAAWPGHVRELASEIENAVARAHYEGAAAVDEHHIFPSIPPASGTPLTYREATRRFQRRYLEEALERHGWVVARAATELGITRQHLHELMTSFELRRP